MYGYICYDGKNAKKGGFFMVNNAVVKYRNDINKIKLGTLSSKEQDIFFSLIYKAKNQKDHEIMMPFKEVETLIDDKKNTKRLILNLKSLSRKLSKLSQEIELPDGNFVLFNLFNRFIVDVNEKVLKISVNEDFKFLLNDLIGNFTRFELRHLIDLKSSYSKILFRLLKQYQSSGWYEIDLVTFRDILDIPEGYDMDNINKRVLKPIMNELPIYFNDLEVEKIKKGRKIHKLKFTWDNKAVEVIPKASVVDEVLQNKINAVNAAIPNLSTSDIEALLDVAEVGMILEKYYTLAIGKEIENLTGFLMDAIKKDWKKTAEKSEDKKAKNGEMDEIERKLQKRLFEKLNNIK